LMFLNPFYNQNNKTIKSRLKRSQTFVSVNGYLRRNPSGTISYVRSHIRTSPDGILENNLSYRRPFR
jgi:hypothetical protein